MIKINIAEVERAADGASSFERRLNHALSEHASHEIDRSLIPMLRVFEPHRQEPASPPQKLLNAKLGMRILRIKVLGKVEGVVWSFKKRAVCCKLLSLLFSTANTALALATKVWVLCV